MSRRTGPTSTSCLCAQHLGHPQDVGAIVVNVRLLRPQRAVAIAAQIQRCGAHDMSRRTPTAACPVAARAANAVQEQAQRAVALLA